MLAHNARCHASSNNSNSHRGLNAALKAMQWPKPKAAVAREAFGTASLEAFRAAFRALLDLQNPYARAYAPTVMFWTAS